MLYYTILYFTLLYYTILYYTLLYYTILYPHLAAHQTPLCLPKETSRLCSGRGTGDEGAREEGVVMEML